MRIAVVGTGCVGLVAGACLAKTGNDVLGCDIDARKIARLNAGEVPICKPGLEPLVERNLADGRLAFTTDVDASVAGAESIVIAVGTPPGEDGSADLKNVLAVASTIGRNMPSDGPEKIVITKSTAPVGAAVRVRETIRLHTTRSVHVCSNPELKEGAAVQDFMKPSHMVVGVDSEYANEKLGEMYAPFVRTGNPILFMDIFARIGAGRRPLCGRLNMRPTGVEPEMLVLTVFLVLLHLDSSLAAPSFGWGSPRSSYTRRTRTRRIRAR